MRRLLPTRTHRLLLTGVVVILAAVALIVTAPHPNFGWFAYAPLSDTTFLPSVHPWQERVGHVLVLVGAVVAAFALGRLSAPRR